MDITLKKLQALVSTEMDRAREELISKEFAYIELIEILRHLDSAFIKEYLNKTESIQEVVYFNSIRFAWVGLLAYYLNHIDAGQATLTFQSTEGHKKWASHLLGWTGDLETVSRYSIAAQAGLATVTETDENTFLLTFPHDIIEKEHYDRESYFFVKDLIARNNQEARQRVTAKHKQVRKQMLDGSRIVEGAFIAYAATPDVDRYFSQLAYYHLAREQTFEDFGPSDSFGGLPYKKYLDVLQEVIGTGLKHLDYCQLAVEKYPGLELHNNTVYTWHEDRIWNDYSNFMGTPLPVIQQIFSCLTLDKNNVNDYVNVKGSDLPPYIKITENQLTRTTYGTLGGGIDFLKRELKRRYRSDYDLAVNRREARFRTDIYQYFKGVRFLTSNEEIEIKLPGLHTDIDGAIYDTKTKTLGLFQLKWQDMFYTSLQERRSRISNAYASAEGWVNKMQEWLRITPPSEVMKKLKFDPVHQDYSKVCLFVIVRNQMHYTGLEPEPVAAWASWYQLVESYERYKINTKDPVKDLYDQLKMGLPSNRVTQEGYPAHPAYAINFKSFKFNFYDDRDENQA
jgi:hypothetical protein